MLLGRHLLTLERESQLREELWSSKLQTVSICFFLLFFNGWRKTIALLVGKILLLRLVHLACIYNYLVCGRYCTLKRRKIMTINVTCTCTLYMHVQSTDLNALTDLVHVHNNGCYLCTFNYFTPIKSSSPHFRQTAPPCPQSDQTRCCLPGGSLLQQQASHQCQPRCFSPVLGGGSVGAQRGVQLPEQYPVIVLENQGRLYPGESILVNIMLYGSNVGTHFCTESRGRNASSVMPVVTLLLVLVAQATALVVSSPDLGLVTLE